MLKNFGSAGHNSGDAQVTDSARPGVLTLQEVANRLRCSKAHLCNVVNGKLPGLPPLPIVRIGRRILIRVESLDQWLNLLEANTTRVR